MSQEESLEAGGTEEKINIKVERKPNKEDENLDADNDQEDRKDDEKWSKVEALVKSFQDCISNQPDMLRECLKKHPNIPKFISDEGKGGNMKEIREDKNDKKWFEGVPKRFRTKSEFMRHKAESRTKNNFQKIKRNLLSSIPNNDRNMRRRTNEVINKFERELEENRWYDKRFDKTADENQRLCNNDGTFKCQGPYYDVCPHSHHHINPYLRNDYWREFSSWNLEYQIQRGRKVLPRLKEALEDPDSRDVNWVYFYELLFMMKNFKLVHPACHHVEDHTRKEVDMRKLFLEPE